MADVRKDLNLTPQERRIVEYHDESIRSGKVGQMDGKPVKVYSMGIKIPPGEKFAGSFVAVPGWLRDKGRVAKDEAEVYKFWKKEIDEGKWPMYGSGSELNQRSQSIHQIMDMEEKRARGKMK